MAGGAPWQKVVLGLAVAGAAVVAFLALSGDQRARADVGPLVAIAALAPPDAGAAALEHAGPLAGPLVGPLVGPRGADVAASAPERAAAPALASADDTARSTFLVRVVERGTGAPVEGAELSLRVAGAEVAAAARTDAAGRATLATAFPRADLSVASGRHVDVHRADVPAGPEALVELEPSGALVGRVDFAGRGALGEVEVRLWAEGRGRGERKAPLTPSGTFRFDDLAPGFVTVALAAEDVPLVHEPSIPIRAGEETTVALRASAPARLLGRVVDAADGRPLAGIAVRARPEAQGAPGAVAELGRARATTGLDGGFELAPLVPGRHVVVAETDYGARVEREVVVASPDMVARAGATEPIELRLLTATWLEGRVVDERGAAVGGLTVAVVREDDVRLVDWHRLRVGVLPAEVHALALARGGVDGRFRCEPVPLGANLAVVVVDLAQGLDDSVAALEGVARVRTPRQREPVEPVVVRVRRMPALTGVVVDAEARPVAKADVTLEGESAGGASVFGQRARTDAAGEFVLRASADGEVRLKVSAEGFHAVVAAFPLAAGQRLAGPVVLERALEVTGTVRDEDGNAVRAAISLVPESEATDAMGRNRGGDRRGVSGYSDRHGRFTVRGLHAGAWRVTARAEAHASLDLEDGVVATVPSAEPLTLVLPRAPRPPRGAVTGELVVFGGDDPVAGVRLDGLGRGAVVFEGARFRAVGLAVGPGRLVASAPGFEVTALPEVAVVADRTVDLGRVAMRPATELVVRVEDAEGKPVRGADVRLDRLPDERAGRSGLPRRLSVPAVRGGPTHRLEATPRARWRLVVSHPEVGRYRAEVDLRAARESLTVRLERP